MRRGCLYRFARTLREVANALIGSFKNSTLDGAADCSTLRVKTQFLTLVSKPEPEGFPARQDRVDRFIERTHTVEPSDRAIKPSALVAMYTTIFRLWTIAPKRRPNPNAEPLTISIK
jgi:hypothetical protein